VATARPRNVTIRAPKGVRTIVTGSVEVKAEIEERIVNLGLVGVYTVVLHKDCPEGRAYVLGDTSTMLY